MLAQFFFGNVQIASDVDKNELFVDGVHDGFDEIGLTLLGELCELLDC